MKRMKRNPAYGFVLLSVVLLPFALSGQNKAERLGPNVNSKYDELTPTISPDGKKLFFIREDDPGNSLSPMPGTQDIWMSKLDSTGQWTPAKHLGLPFNENQYNGIVGISADGNKRYIKGYYQKGEYKHIGFSYCVNTSKGWSKPVGIEVSNYSSMVGANSTISEQMHSDNRILMMGFIKRFKKTQDIYVSFRIDDTHFTEPKKIGLCTDEYDELAPFLAADGVTLYFASNRPGGYGDQDIWMSRRLDDTWENWSTPVNLGQEVNTRGFDAYYSIAAQGDYAYMIQGGDVVRIRLKEELRPNPVALVSGNVLDKKTRKPVEATITYFTLGDNVEAGTARSSPGTGDYSIILPYGKSYGFRAQADGYYAISQNLDLSELKAYKEIRQDLQLVPIEVGQVIRLNNIFFEFGKAALKPESSEELDRVVKLLTDNPSMEIDIAGHTDNVGSDEANSKLSADRAQAVYDYFVSKGIAASRLSFKGYGESAPVADNNTEDGRAMNRRVEFTIRKR